MKNMYGKSILVGAIIGVLAVGVSFAAFSATLTVNGTATLSGDFNVKFTAVSASDTKATTSTPTISSDTGVLSFDVSTELEEPGSQSVISYTISNLGTIGATLATPSITCYSDALKESQIECSDTNISINAGTVSPTSLAASNTATGTITIKWESTSTEVPEQTERYYTVTINANQAS